jgi:hypothetical protein
MWSGRQRVTIVVCVAAAGVLAITIGAAFGAKLKAKSVTTTIASGEAGTVTAKCKKGTKAVSGGFESDFDPSFLIPTSSSRVGRRSWSTEAFSADESGPLTTSAYCRDQKVKSKLSEEAVVAPNERETATAKCKKGTKAVSGGFVSEFDPDGPFLFTEDSRRLGKRKWAVTGVNFGDESGTMTAQVNCVEGDPPKARDASELISWEGGMSNVDESVTASCKRGERVVSGGFTGPSVLPPTGVVVFASHRVSKRKWEVSGVTGVENSEPVVAIAYCEKA